MADIKTPADPELPEADGLFQRLKKWFEEDSEHTEKWREEAKEDYAFVAGDQWDSKDVRSLKDAQRPVITFDRIGPLIRSVVGEQINSSQEVRYIPREMGDVAANEMLTEAARWFRDQCGADSEESEMFWDATVCGVGWTDSRIDMEENPDEPMPVVERIDPMEMFWDCDARKPNLSDARRVWRVRDIPIASARALAPDVADSDLDASWARNGATDGVKTPGNDRDDYSGDGDTESSRGDDATVTIVQVQWADQETVWRVQLPQTDPMQPPQPPEEMDDATYLRVAKRLTEIGARAVKVSKKVYRKAFLGRTILKEGPLKCPHFTFQAMTGFRDRNAGTWYGLVRAMKDPQRWANKWLSQTLHIMNSTAKGGVMMERDSVDDARQFEESFAKPDAVTWLPPGALSNPMGPKIQPKPVGQFPQGFYQMMQYAISSVRDASGINLEMLGMREADQAASLEFQRRQAGMTILAQLFQALRRYHQVQGKVMLYYIQNVLSPDTLVRIIGQDGKQQFQPLAAVNAMKSADVKYDIIVDEGPSSPNQKERIWGMVGQQFWELPPPIQMALLEYSPFPESVVQKVKEAAEQASQGPQAQMQEKMMALEAMLTEAKVLLTNAQAQKAQADAQATMIEASQPQQGGDPLAGQADMQKIVVDAQVKSQKTAADLQLGREKIAADKQINAGWIASEERKNLINTAVQADTARATAQVAAKSRNSRPSQNNRP
jgi:hypothetical protein